jgi:hypothetical protein
MLTLKVDAFTQYAAKNLPVSQIDIVFYSDIPSQQTYIGYFQSAGGFTTIESTKYVVLNFPKEAGSTVSYIDAYVEKVDTESERPLSDVMQLNKAAIVHTGEIQSRNDYNMALFLVTPNTDYVIKGIDSANVVVFYNTKSTPGTSSYITGYVNVKEFKTPDNCYQVAIDLLSETDYSGISLSPYNDVEENLLYMKELAKGIIATKPLTKLLFYGDSLTANEIGGSVPLIYKTASTRTPMRLVTWNFPRRMYEMLSTNCPEWRRLDDSDWTLSGFTLMSQTWRFNAMQGTVEPYYESNAQGNYCEITIPKEYRNFALICRTASDAGVIGVTINGAAPTTYKNPYYTNKVAENTVITTDVVPEYIPVGPSSINLLLSGSSGIGNLYHIVEFHNLPDNGTDNVIRFTSQDAAHNCIWGGFYWNGNTFVCMNGAIGGRSVSDFTLSHILQDNILTENYDYIILEAMLMNLYRDAHSQGMSKARELLEDMIDMLDGQNVIYTSTSPWGISIKNDTNYATENTNPTLPELTNLLRTIVKEKDVPFIDIYRHFEVIIKARGGTLDGGEGGLWYCHDGMHGNEDGCKEWFLELFRKWINLHI